MAESARKRGGGGGGEDNEARVVTALPPRAVMEGEITALGAELRALEERGGAAARRLRDGAAARRLWDGTPK